MSGVRGIPTRVVVVPGLVVALLLAGVASNYAASAPDGLNRVAQEQGFAATEEQRNDVTPLSGYETAGVEHGRLSGGLAGLTGCVVVLALAGGLTRVLRTRARAEAAASPRAPTDPLPRR